jgi:hypothetical protein
LLLDSEETRRGHFLFCHALHVAMQVGPYLPPGTGGLAYGL